jgi:hypothetical protein
MKNKATFITADYFLFIFSLKEASSRESNFYLNMNALIFLPFIKKKTRSLSLSQARLFEAKNK